MTTSRRSFFSVLVGGTAALAAASVEARVEPAVDDVDSLLHEVYTDLHSLMTQLRDENVLVSTASGEDLDSWATSQQTGHENAGHTHSFSCAVSADHMHTYSGTTWPTRGS